MDAYTQAVRPDPSSRSSFSSVLADLRRSPPAVEAVSLVMESLVAAGAPLWHWQPRQSFSLEELLPLALRLSHSDATVLRVLPLVLARNWNSLNWSALVQRARSADEVPALGMVVELTGELTDQRELVQKAAELEQVGALNVQAAYFPGGNKYDLELAQDRTPLVARKWGFLMNMTVEAFRGLLEKHHAPLHG